jgi:glycosyltransferase involved in cell wall biosynthesis
MPAVSVLMAVYNGERHLGAAIDSILAQTWQDFEFIIVDDGSTDGSRDIVAGRPDPRIRLVVLERNHGLSGALNAGLSVARSPLIARQDADDLSEPHRLARQVALMHERPELALLGSRAIAIDEAGQATGTVWRPVEESSIRWYALFDNPFAHTSVVFRTAVVRDELGGYEAAYDPFSQDYALWCRLMERHQVGNVPDRLVRYRVSAASITGALGQRDQPYRERFAAIVREIIARHAMRTMPDVVSEQDARLMSAFVLGLGDTRLPAFLEVFERVLGAFCQRHPGACTSPGFLDTLARQFDAIAMRAEPPSRLKSGAVYAHALRHHPAVATHVSWPRALALVVLGRTGRDRLAGWKRAGVDFT